MATQRSRVLELAVLGHLSTAPMHGYELRKRLNREFGAFRPFSYGTLYPCLKHMLLGGLVDARGEDAADGGGRRRSRIVYRLTEEGRGALRRLLADSAPASVDDECFGVHFTLFGRTRGEVRMRILRDRRTRMLERLDGILERLDGLGGRGDPYAYELHRHRAESARREVEWLEGLIECERRCAEAGGAAGENIGGTALPPTGPQQ